MMSQERFELPACCSASKRSIQLSYWDVGLDYSTNFKTGTIQPMSFGGLTQTLLNAPNTAKLLAEITNPLPNANLPALQILRAARPLVVAAVAEQVKVPILYVVSSIDQSRAMVDALRRLTEPEAVLRLAEPNTAFYDTVAPVADVIAQRSAVLAKLALSGRSAIAVASPRALMHLTLPRVQFVQGCRTLMLDQTLRMDEALAHWLKIGYQPQSVVEHVGEFSRRGGIIDIWSPAMSLPARIELWGDVVDSIRLFDPSTQRSDAKLDQLTITPLEIENLKLRKNSEAVLNSQFSILNFLSGGLLLVDDEAELRMAWDELERKAERERLSLTEAPQLTNKPYLTWDEFRAEHNARVIVLGQSAENSGLSQPALAQQFTSVPHFAGQLPPLMQYLEEIQRQEGRNKSQEPRTKIQEYSDAHALRTQHSGLSTQDSALSTSSTVVVVSRQAARLAELWSEKHGVASAAANLPDAPLPGVTFVTGALSGGFKLALKTETEKLKTNAAPHSKFLILLTDAEIFGQVRLEPSAYSRPRKAAPERAFSDWQTGDVVVHEDYGIGRFRGLTKLTVSAQVSSPTPHGGGEGSGEIEREYLLLEFADADRLYVPLHQLDRISRYIGNDDAAPTLSKLHSGEWETARRKAKGAAADTAREMLKLYAERELADGFNFSNDTHWQQELELSFPYVETDDQFKAIEAVKTDMQRKRPMDRLICGDVGFGKTEVALRAAFKAAQDGKQVAVLVPTTVLAQQHWNTFSRRLAMFPVKVEMLSRFRTSAEKRKIIESLEAGAIDIIIGTHALVSEGVKFKDLGLLIIDEEQRFGMKDKEKLKKLRTSVDVLTLSATPIPRTLYMGLAGIRDVSRIETPPAERLPIITHIGPQDDNVIQQAIRRELDRDGQVFFVHNRIQGIGLLEQKLARLVPEARMAVAHGQMDEKRLAFVMNQFAEGKTDILLCTNIIESGLDIPNANTIIIDQAQMFGLSELYQLRGRVGRSTTQAYAYCLHDRRSQMTDDARERLQAMREAAGLGAGYMVAMRDLELRGAGDMLGPKQSGQVSSVGLDLYTRLLAREVTVLRAMRDGTAMPAAEVRPITIDIPLTVGLPESYVPDHALRVQMYRRVASLDNENKIQTFEDELQDRFGKLPPAAKNLTYQARLKLYAERFGAQSITSEGNRFTIRADAIEHMQTEVLRLKLGESGLIGRKQLSFLRTGTAEQWKDKLMGVLLWMAGQAKPRENE